MKTFAQWAEDHGLSESEKGVAEAAWQAALSAHPSPGGQGGVLAWVVGDGVGARWRMWGAFGPNWTTDRNAALHFARRSDAEAFAKDDEEAWVIQHVALAARQPVGQELRTDLVPGVVRCAKCAFQLHRSTLYLQSGTVGSGGSKTEPCPNGCGPLWPVTWEMWAREGWAEAERLHLENAALSAQPSPGGQGEPVGTIRDRDGVFEIELSESAHDTDAGALDGRAVYLAARQPVGEPVAYWLAVDKDGIVEFGMSADDGNAGQAARQEMNDFINGPLHDGGVPHRLVGVYAAPPAQAVDLGAVREAVRKAWQKCAAGESVDLQFGTLLALIDSQVKPK